MSANTIITSIVNGGTSSHATVSEEANVIATDFVTQGVVGAITLNAGSGGTGSFCVNADASPDMGVTVKAGQAYITATPSSQDSQVLRARASSDYTAYTINANSSGSTKYDWIYLQVNATKANNPASDASDVTAIYTSRSSSNTTDNGTPPTYGLLLAIVTVANGASSITNSNITDSRFNTSIGAQNGSLIVTQASTGTDAIIQAAGIDANVNITLSPKGTGAIKGVVSHLYNPYKFSVYVANAENVGTGVTKITFDTKLFDTGSNFDSATNHRFIAPIGGYYQLNASILTTVVGACTRFLIMLYQNGSEIMRILDTSNNTNGYIVGASGGMLVKAAASDYFEVYCQAIGAAKALDVSSAGGYANAFEGFLVSAT